MRDEPDRVTWEMRRLADCFDGQASTIRAVLLGHLTPTQAMPWLTATNEEVARLLLSLAQQDVGDVHVNLPRIMAARLPDVYSRGL